MVIPVWLIFMVVILNLVLSGLAILFFIEVLVFGIKIRLPKKKKGERF